MREGGALLIDWYVWYPLVNKKGPTHIKMRRMLDKEVSSVVQKVAVISTHPEKEIEKETMLPHSASAGRRSCRVSSRRCSCRSCREPHCFDGSCREL